MVNWLIIFACAAMTSLIGVFFAFVGKWVLLMGMSGNNVMVKAGERTGEGCIRFVNAFYFLRQEMLNRKLPARRR
jgi:ABC-type transport system involved in cytochrome c biogenesis permease subunit